MDIMMTTKLTQKKWAILIRRWWCTSSSVWEDLEGQTFEDVTQIRKHAVVAVCEYRISRLPVTLSCFYLLCSDLVLTARTSLSLNLSLESLLLTSLYVQQSPHHLCQHSLAARATTNHKPAKACVTFSSPDNSPDNSLNTSSSTSCNTTSSVLLLLALAINLLLKLFFILFSNDWLSLKSPLNSLVFQHYQQITTIILCS